MAWTEPKTNWTEDDFFNVEDYRRITNNIMYLKDFLDSLFYGLSDMQSMSEKNISEPIYAREINYIENNIELLNIETYRLEIGDTKEYFPNQRTMDFNELNRIEKAMFDIYTKMKKHKELLTRLSFRLGNQKGLKV